LKYSAEVRAFISENFFVDGFDDEVSFLETGVIDSMGMVELISFLEKRFGFKIEEDELMPENLDSVVNICRFVERKLSHGAAGAADSSLPSP
jgi:acyl carrier protein